MPRQIIFPPCASLAAIFFSAERRDPSGDTAAVGDDKQKVIVVAVVLNAAVVCCDLGKSTWNLKIICLKRKIFSQTFILGFHVNFQGCVECLLWFFARGKPPICRRVFCFCVAKTVLAEFSQAVCF